MLLSHSVLFLTNILRMIFYSSIITKLSSVIMFLFLPSRYFRKHLAIYATDEGCQEQKHPFSLATVEHACAAP